MAEFIINERLIEPGEPYFALYVDRPGGAGRPLVGELAIGLIGPVASEQSRPKRLSGFELPALEAAERAQRRAAEQGVKRILVVDPYGQLTLARIGAGSKR